MMDRHLYYIQIQHTNIMFANLLQNLTKKANDQPQTNNAKGERGITNEMQQYGLEAEQAEQIQEVQQITHQRVPYEQSYDPITPHSEDNNPMYISGVAVAAKPIDKLKALRIRNTVSELRQVQLDLIDLLEEQRNMAEIQHQRLCLQIQDFFNQHKQLVIQEYLQNHQKQASSEANRDTSHMNKEANQLKKQLDECKRSLERQQQRNQAFRKGQLKDKVEKESPCQNCQFYIQKYAKTSAELRDTENQLQKLLVQNQNLQEHVFDIEQKVVGVDLQVERKINEYVKNTGKGGEGSQQTKLIDQLNQQITELQERVAHYDRMVIDQQEMNERLRKLQNDQHNYRMKDAALRQTIIQIQQQKENNYQREHQILIAQENLSDKIADLRKKEVELSEWEAELTKRASISRNQPPKVNQPSSHHFTSNQDLYIGSDKESLKSFGMPQQLYDSPAFVGNSAEAPRYEPPVKQSQNAYNINILPTSQAKYERQIAQRRTDSRKVVDSAYAPRNREHAVDLAKKYVPTGSRYRDNREPSPYRGQDRARGQHQFTLPQGRYNSPGNFRELSKHSRSSANKSISKSIRGGHGVPALQDSRGKEQLGGLGSKLQRLREEIKRQIDSIK